jgi:hypothetical protein
MKLFKAFAGIAAIFILGAMTGVLGTTLVVKHRIEIFHKKGPPSIKPMLMKRITDRIDLTSSQRESVEKILDELQIQLRELRQDFRPKMKGAFDASFERIKELLDDSQKKQIDILLKELPDHFPHHRRFGSRECDKDMRPPDERPLRPEF